MQLTSGFREVFAKQKFGWSLQGGISKSLLCGETASRPTEGTVFMLEKTYYFERSECKIKKKPYLFIISINLLVDINGPIINLNLLKVSCCHPLFTNDLLGPPDASVIK